MTKWRKAALGLAGAVVLAATAGGLALRALVDPAHLAKAASERARAAFGRELSTGAVRLDLLPRPTLVARNLAIANPSWAKARDLARARRVVARLAFWPLLAGEARVTSVALEGVQLDLEVRPDGEKNWAIGGAQARPSTEPPADAAWSDIAEVRISDAQVAYRRSGGAVDSWSVERASVDMQPGLRDVRVDARLARGGRPLHLTGRFADLSRLGRSGAASQGEVQLDWGRTRLVAAGRFPLDHGMEPATFDATLASDSLEDVLAFLGRPARHTARVEAHARVVRSAGKLELRNLVASLGGQTVTGDLRFELAAKPARFAARLASKDLDWGRALLDAGNPKPPPNPKGEMFAVRPLPWGMLAAMEGKRGEADLAFGRLVLPDGIEFRDASGHVAIQGDHLRLRRFAARTLGGSVRGSLGLEARGKAAQLELAGEGVLLERWFRERHRPIHFRGGPMKLRISIRAAGDSMKALAASATGPVSIAMGRGVWDSKVAGDWEARMVNFAKDENAIDFECVGAALPFQAGRAKGRDIVGARSRESRLLLSGTVDLRKEDVDLKGRVRPKPDSGVGLSTIADDIQIAGPLHRMKVRLDPESKPEVIAKGALAIVTAGISAVASAASNSAAPDPDPCGQVFTKEHPPRP